MAGIRILRGGGGWNGEQIMNFSRNLNWKCISIIFDQMWRKAGKSTAINRERLASANDHFHFVGIIKSHFCLNSHSCLFLLIFYFNIYSCGISFYWRTQPQINTFNYYYWTVIITFMICSHFSFICLLDAIFDAEQNGCQNNENVF